MNSRKTLFFFLLFILDLAVQNAKGMQDFNTESFLRPEHFQKVKTASIKSDGGAIDCVDLATSTIESRFLFQLKQKGYVEICNTQLGQSTFNSFYTYFNDLIEFLQTNPFWAQKLYAAKERFIRSKDRNCYSTDFFGFYNESEREARRQISFYYSIHFHEFIYSHYPEFKQIPEITRFFEACLEIQKPCENLFNAASVELGLEAIFASKYDHPPILLKVVKYFPSYIPTRPHYDGTALSLFLDSTDNQSLLLSPYKSSFIVDDFSSPQREFSQWHNQKSILLIPGTLLTEFSIYPTPHIVVQSSKIRYATIAFAMRPNYTPKKIEFPPLPHFKY